MGFEIHSEENPRLLRQTQRLGMESVSRLAPVRIRSNQQGNNAQQHCPHFAFGNTGVDSRERPRREEMETFDITEHKIELQVNRDDDYEVNKMEILDTDLPDGRKLFHGAALHLTKDTPEDVVSTLGEMVIVSIGAFQHMEDKMYAAREKVPCFRELGRNGTLLKGDEIWALYDCMLNIFSAMEMPDMLRITMFPKQKRIIPEFTKEQSEAINEFVKENIQPHDLGNMPRLFGVISQTIAMGEDLRIS